MCNNSEWDWISIRDRFSTLAGALEVPPDSHTEIADELRSMADWIEQFDHEEDCHA